MALQALNATSLVVGLPEGATLPGNIAFAAWLGATAWLVSRPATIREPSIQPAAA